MRWLWIDRFVEFERGRRAVAIKNVSIVEEEIDDYTPGFPIMPAALIIEGMAQTAGLLIGEKGGFQDRVVLAKVGRAVFHHLALPGDQLRYTAVVQDMRKDGSLAQVTSHIGGELHAEVELMFAFLPLDERFPSGPLCDTVDFLAMVRAFALYDVAKTETGEPAEPPEAYLKFEREAQQGYPAGPLKM
jgi:3-hydroxyacyl-[acyl-carrier-protein] dehydratase